jgi:hypothetical protein
MIAFAVSPIVRTAYCRLRKEIDGNLMKGRALLSLVQELTALLDTGQYDAIPIEQIHEHIEKGDVLTFVCDLGGRDIDLSIHLKTDTYGDFEAWCVEGLQRMFNAYGGDERRKWGVERRGLCLLITWIIELAKLGEDVEWSRQ